MKFKSEVQLEALNNAPTDTDKFLVSDGSTVKYRTGAQLLSDIGGITSLNGLTATTQTLVTGNEGTDFDIISNGIDQHIFNLPDASLLNRGVVTIGAQGFAGAKIFYEDLTVNGLTIGEGGVIGSTGLNNIAIGINALNVNNASNNIAIGNYSLRVNQDGFQNIAIGTESLWNNISGDYNTAIGHQTLRANTANNNTAIGSGALKNNTVGFQNTAIGTDALLSNIDGEENTAIGKDALKSNTDANWNTAIGNSALQNNTIGYQNTSIGRFSSLLNISGNYNMAIGVDSLRANTISNYNTAIGHKAGHTITGFQNTFIGGQDDLDPSLQLVTANDSIAIGYNAYTTKSNQVVLGSSLITETLLRGDIKLTTSPTTSPGSYQILTINTVGGPNTGRIESVLSSSIQKTISIGPIDAGANTNGISLASGGGLTLHAATSTTGGVVTTASQTFAGAKTFTENINWAQTDRGIAWAFNTDGAYIKFLNTGDADANSRLEFATLDNNNEYFRWGHIPSGLAFYESMKLLPLSSGNAELIVAGKVIANSFEKSGGNNNQILAAQGGIITAGTNITISGGVISSSGGSTLSMGSISATANANGATISGSVLNLAAATNTSGGVVTNGAQTFSTGKQFTDNLQITTTSSTASIGLDSGGSNVGTISCNSSFYQFNAINSTGYLFKNSSGTNTFTLNQSGNATFLGSVTASGFFGPSDARLKDIIEQEGDTVKFTWKDKRDDKIHIGYVAQEVQEKYPDQVSEDTNGMLTVNYIEVLVAKIQELENRIKQLEK